MILKTHAYLIGLLLPNEAYCKRKGIELNGNFGLLQSIIAVAITHLVADYATILLVCICLAHLPSRECSGSVVECLTRDRGAAGLSLTGVTVLWSLSKTLLS